MDFQLSPIEARILGSLIEKQMATPDYYPMTLNSLVSACNQLSSRDPVMSLDDKTVVRGLDSLRDKRLVWTVAAAGSRVPKYEHRAGETLGLDTPELAILAVLLLRGYQTAGEIRGRTERLYQIETVEQAATVLEKLSHREPALVVKLPVQPGSKEPRYAHLLSGAPALPERSAIEARPEPARLEAQAEEERFAALEKEIASLREEVNGLREQFERFRRQFE